MLNQKSLNHSYDPALAAKVWWLIIGRLTLISLIVLGGWLWVRSGAANSLVVSSPPLIAFLLTAVLLTTLYLLWWRFARTLLWQIRTQFLIDTVLITWLVWETGDFISPYITLYIMMISLAGFFLGKSDAIWVAGACSICFSSLSLISPETFTYSLTGEVVPSRTVQAVAFNDAAFLIVGLLAARIAERRKIGDRLKQAESDFSNLSVLHERILASINSGLITTDLQGKIYAFNNAAQEITGIDAAVAIGRSVFSVFGDEIRLPIESCLKGTQTVEFSPPNFEIGLRPELGKTENGRKVTIACTVLPLVGGSQGITGLIIAFHDTTELRLMEENLRRSDRLAAIGRMAAGLAHEIRNPLGAMSSALQFMSVKTNPDDRDTALMAVVLSESERLNTIIKNFLTYARPGPHDEADRELARIDVGEAISDCLTLLRHDPAVHEKHVFDFEMPDRQMTIVADETPVKQIFWNLFRNSIESMPDGGRLSVDLLEPNPKEVRVVVSDTGRGIKAGNIERIFEPFQSESNGTGLGLSIVHRIVTEGGGRIDVASEPGIGTRVTVDLLK